MGQRAGSAPPPDAWTQAVLFLDAKDAVRTRLVSRAMSGAFDRACWICPAPAATLPSTDAVAPRFAERVCRSLHRSPCDDGTVPLWLRYVRRNVLLAVLAYGGCATAFDGLASGPFFLGTEDARSGDNSALRRAAYEGRVAVIDRLALLDWHRRREKREQPSTAGGGRKRERRRLRPTGCAALLAWHRRREKRRQSITALGGQKRARRRP